MNRLISKISILLGLFITTILFSAIPEDGIFAVISPQITRYNRPLLWKNRDSDSTNTSLHAFRGNQYDFIGLIKNNDTTLVYAGQNTTGFSLVYNSTENQDNIFNKPARLVKKALEQCSTIKEFNNLLLNSTASNSIYGCIDSRGNGAVFECSNDSVIVFDVNDINTSPNGFLVRQQFRMSSKTKISVNSWKYHRANQLLIPASKNKNITSQFILQIIARDLVSQDLDPYPLPFAGKYKDAPEHFINTENTINNYRTTNCFVFYASSTVLRNEIPGFFYIPGNPICGIAMPLWPQCGQVPKPLKSMGFMSISHALQSIYSRIYRKSKWPHFFDSKMLAKNKNSVFYQNLEIESQIIENISTLKNIEINERVEIQKSLALQVLKKL